MSNTIIDVTFNTLRTLRADQEGGRYFYIDRKRYVEVYAVMGGFLFRYTRKKEGGEKDMLFFSEELKNAIPVLNISNVNDEGYKRSLRMIISLLNDIKEKINGPNR